MSDAVARLIAALEDRYAIARELGAGGMATVYLARDIKHDRQVALKVLRPEIAAVLGAERFFSEIRVTAHLQHTHILPLFDSGEAAGLIYYVMPYVEGETLRTRLLRERQLAVQDAIEITKCVAAALDHAHRRGIAHRDIKPENILLADGQAVVADFGIALALSAAAGSRMTQTGLSLGTPEYMSPEQAAGLRAIDGRTDIFSLACVLYEMLAGDPPHSAPTAQAIISKIIAEPARPVRMIRDSVPMPVEAALMRALAKSPDQRFATAGQFAEALANASPTASAAAANWPRRRVLVTLGGVAALGGMYKLVSGIWGARSAPSTVQSLAVLPLASLSMDTSQAYFADAMTDLLITHLARSPNLRVTSRTSTLQYRGGAKAVPEIGRDLHVDLVVEGTVVKEGQRVRITAQLIRARTDEHVWANSFERNFGDVLALQQEVAQAIASEIGVRLAPWQTATGPVHDPQAQEEYLRGIYYYGLGDMTRSAESLERAVMLDPGHALAYAALARSCYFIAFFGDRPPREAFERMERAAKTAVEKDPTIASAHGSLALVKLHRDWKWNEAEEHFRHALELNPSSADIHHDYAHFLLVVGRDRESVAETEKAVALDPFNPMLNACLGWHRLFAGQYDQAIAASRRALQLQPANFWAHVNLGWAYEQKAMYTEAAEQFKQTLQQPPMAMPSMDMGAASGSMSMSNPVQQQPMAMSSKDSGGTGGSMSMPNPVSMQMAGAEARRIQATRADLVVLAAASLGHALGLAGDRKGAESMLDRLMEQGRHAYVSPYDIALLYSGLGDKGKALDWLERAYQERSSLLIFALREPRLASLRTEPRFAALIRDFALPQ